jgi:hypothetical protein
MTRGKQVMIDKKLHIGHGLSSDRGKELAHGA